MHKTFPPTCRSDHPVERRVLGKEEHHDFRHIAVYTHEHTSHICSAHSSYSSRAYTCKTEEHITPPHLPERLLVERPASWENRSTTTAKTYTLDTYIARTPCACMKHRGAFYPSLPAGTTAGRTPRLARRGGPRWLAHTGPAAKSPRTAAAAAFDQAGV